MDVHMDVPRDVPMDVPRDAGCLPFDSNSTVSYTHLTLPTTVSG